jgi:hypothetical protein
MESQSKQFFLFRGSWVQLYDALVGTIQFDKQQKFAMWRPLAKKDHYQVLIVYGTTLPESFMETKNIFPITENHFTVSFLDSKDEYSRLGFDEYRKSGKKNKQRVAV